MTRELDGVYFRIERNGKWQVPCFSDLTAEEREKVCKGRDAEWFKSLAYHLADCIKEIGEQFDIVRGEAIEEYKAGEEIMSEVKVNGMKLCPWCGSEGRVNVCNGKYSVVCSHTNWCEVLPSTWQYDTEEEAIEAWNNRKENE